MWSAFRFNLDQSKNFLSRNGLIPLPALLQKLDWHPNICFAWYKNASVVGLKKKKKKQEKEKIVVYTSVFPFSLIIFKSLL